MREQINISLCQSIHDTKNVQTLPFAQYIEFVGEGLYSEEIDNVRRLEYQSKEYKKAKEQLPCIVPHSIIKTRSQNGIVKRTGLFCFDFDIKDNPNTDPAEAKNRILKNPSIIALHNTTSKGFVFFLLVNIKKESWENHKSEYNAVREELERIYDIERLDPSQHGLIQPRFVGSDPDVFFNPDAKPKDIPKIKTLKPKTESKKSAVKVQVETDKLQNVFKEIVSFLEETDESITKDYDDWVGVGFSLANTFEEDIAREMFHGISQFDESYAERDCDSAFDRVLRSVKHGEYNEAPRTFSSIYWAAVKKGFELSEELKGIQFSRPIEDVSIQELTEEFSFIKEFKKKDQTIYYIDENKFLDWLSDFLGFGIYFRQNDMLIIRVVNNVIYNFNREKLKSFVSNYFRSYPELREMIMRKKGLMSQEKMAFLRNLTEEATPIRDRKDNSYFFFLNGFVEVINNNISEVIPYDKMEFLIWYSDIIQHTFNKAEYKSLDFVQFLQNITNNNPHRFKALQTIIGYNLHTYKDPGFAKSVVLVDEGSNPDEANGGTGKSLIVEAISKVRTTIKQDGKRFGKNNIRFLYQDVSEETKILAIDDIDRYFNWSFLFSVITTGMQVEQKGLAPFYIPFERSPKLLITTNYMVRGNDSSTKRRFIEFEIYPYYSDKKTPRDDFKKSFFFDWTQEEWNQFYSFMAQCVNVYLQEGIIEFKTEKSGESKLRTMTSNEFVDWAWERYLPGREYGLKSELDFFTDDYPDFKDGKNKLTNKKWGQWLRAFAECSGFRYERNRSGATKESFFSFYENSN